ncbi:MAG: restriction endonuclease subunit S [Bacteroidales bacterium]|nr:restriction endonuclease subunit S [Bacteroidales bacterium]
MKTEQEHNNEQCTMNNVQWKKVKLGEVCAVNPKTDTTKVLDDDFVTFVRMEDVSNDGIIASFSERPYKSLLKKGFTIFQNDDVIFAKITPCMENGKGALVRNMKSKICMGSTEFHVLRACDNVSIDFIYQLTISKQFRQRAEMQMTGSAGQQRVPTAFLEDYLISIPFKNGKPDLSAQRRIAAILASADKVIAATQKTIAKYKQIKQGMMEDLLNEQCTMNNVQWRKVKLGEGCNRMCNGMTYDIDEKEGYLVTRIETISDGYIDYNRVGHTKELPKEDYKLLKGDILFSHINSVKHIGKVAYFDGEELLYHGMNLLLLRANNEINSKFLYYLLSSETVRQRMRTLAKSAVNQASINTTELQKFSFFIPDLVEQHRIAAILSGIDAKIAAEEKVLEKYEKVKKGLMERLLNEQ